MPEIYSIWIVIVFLVAVIVYAWNENRLWRKEIKRIDHLDSYEEKNTDLLRLLVSITGAVFICLTFILAILALFFFNGDLFK